MFVKLNRRRAQSTGEYVVLVGLVIAAVIGMQIFVKRGLQAKTKNVVEYMIDEGGYGNYTLDSERQYEPYYLGASSTNATRGGSRSYVTSTSYDPGTNTSSTASVTTDITNEFVTRGGTQSYSGANGYEE